ncbi:hypothetical protein ON003_03785 [Janibacter hoylei]|uniref:hypothetical protein n=1 Tax=Janibacter hoylei TaxID=364298 RepID=UPI0022370CAC|nr:hypothetical protein [Janibacter hoylei]MCW4600821.1 hypothetical protein [Janibacter hoylei]
MLAGPLLLPPLLLAVLLCVSGGAKLRHPEETRSAFAQLQLPRALTDSPHRGSCRGPRSSWRWRSW